MEVIIFFTILAILVFTVRHPQQKKQRRNQPPSPPSLPLIGHLHLLKEPMTQTLRSLSAKYGVVLSLNFGLRRRRRVLHKNDIVFANRLSTLSTKHFRYNTTTLSIARYGHHWRNLRRPPHLLPRPRRRHKKDRAHVLHGGSLPPRRRDGAGGLEVQVHRARFQRSVHDDRREKILRRERRGRGGGEAGEVPNEGDARAQREHEPRRAPHP
ncbi:cytochrome P450 81Q32-like [Salvia divinorum]|uniref:Cytochrome P450 81Q32-like n=1 Tax=Salvia divinorum TaxID=28513 RepID=A0ABD1FYN9_SALDI